MYTPESETLDSTPTRTVTGGLSGAGIAGCAGRAAAGAVVAAGAVAAADTGLLAPAARGVAGGGVEPADWQATRTTSRPIQPARAA
jgi:hypothetical protein